jgi:hypothetical protein
MKTQTTSPVCTNSGLLTGSPHTLPGAIDGRAAGSAVHHVIGALLGDGIRHPSPLELRRYVAADPSVNRSAVVYRQAAKQRLLTAAAVYFRLFAPAGTWELLGVEAAYGRNRADLVWRTSGGGVVIDEIKSGVALDRFENERLEQQVARLLTGGAATHGEPFGGVRVVLLATPARSYLARPDGCREPAEWRRS